MAKKRSVGRTNNPNDSFNKVKNHGELSRDYTNNARKLLKDPYMDITDGGKG